MLEGEKRPDMLRQRLCAGVKQAYLFQVAVYPELEEVSALIAVRKDGGFQQECVFGSVYKECIARIRKQRRALFRNLLNVFDPHNLNCGNIKDGDDSSTTDLMLLSYTSQVLAYLPYSVVSDTLFIIHYITSNIAAQGEDLLDKFAVFLRPYGFASKDELDELNAEEDELELSAKLHYPHPAKSLEFFSVPNAPFDKSGFSKLCSEAGCLILLLRLKRFLRETYNLSEARCLEFNPNAKDAVEKPILKSSTSSVFDSKLPTQSQKKKDGDDFLDAMILQYAEFRCLMRSEVNMAPCVNDESDVENKVLNEEPSVMNSKRRRSNS